MHTSLKRDISGMTGKGRFPSRRVQFRGPGHRAAAFTLIEIMLVTCLLVILSGVMIPRMSASYRGLEIRSAAREVVSSIEAATILAIQTRGETRFVFQEEGAQYWIEADDTTRTDQEFTGLKNGPMQGVRTLPKGMKLAASSGLASSSKDTLRWARFFPDGTRDPVIIQIADRREKKRWAKVGPSMGIAEILTEPPDAS